VIDLTKLAFTPNDLCIPEHSIHIKIPLLTETHELNEPFKIINTTVYAMVIFRIG
jgi:hypothetical protein